MGFARKTLYGRITFLCRLKGMNIETRLIPCIHINLAEESLIKDRIKPSRKAERMINLKLPCRGFPPCGGNPIRLG